MGSHKIIFFVKLLIFFLLIVLFKSKPIRISIAFVVTNNTTHFFLITANDAEGCSG